MGRRLSAADAEFYRRVDEVLHYLWDPCGVAGEPYARDEYYSYLPRVFSALKAGEGVEEIAEMLVGIEREWMGLGGGAKKAERAAKVLVNYRKKIFGE